VSATFTKESDTLFVVQVKGTFTFDDQKVIESQISEEIDRSQKVKLLILAEQFSKWGKDGDWGDLTFMFEHDPYIEKIAVVASAMWKDQILMFLGASSRQAAVEFFLEGNEEEARAWLQSE
jgi:hypothetical protein